MTQVIEPFPIFYDDDGTPLDDGMIYVGQANQDPRVNPVTVYTDEARTIPIAQPIRTLGGRPAYQGAPINLYVAEAAYSIAVQNRFGTPIVSAPDVSLSADDFSFIQSGAGAVARTVQSKLRDTVSVKDFGAVGNGIANDTAGITAADAILTKKKYVPAGIYDTTLPSVDLDGPYFGEGQIRDNANNLRAPEFSTIKSPPASFGNWGSPETAFNGDLSKVLRAAEHRISGALTLGQPATGYQFTREAGADLLYGFVSSESGWNQSTTSNTGRTGAAFTQRVVFHQGNGDAFCNWVSAIATGTKTGSTHFLANPAVTLYSGEAYGGANGVLLQGIGDLNFHDLGNDVACQGLTFNFMRTNKTGAKEADWTGFRLQNQGTQNVNAWAAFVGGADLGIDLCKSNFGANQAALTLANGQRIYGNATNSDPVSLSRNTVPGNAWLNYNAANFGWEVIANGGLAAFIGAATFSVFAPFVPRLYAASALPAALDFAGAVVTVSDANSSTRGATVVGGGSNNVLARSVGGVWVIV